MSIMMQPSTYQGFMPLGVINELAGFGPARPAVRLPHGYLATQKDPAHLHARLGADATSTSLQRVAATLSTEFRRGVIAVDAASCFGSLAVGLTTGVLVGVTLGVVLAPASAVVGLGARREPGESAGRAVQRQVLLTGATAAIVGGNITNYMCRVTIGLAAAMCALVPGVPLHLLNLASGLREKLVAYEESDVRQASLTNPSW